MMLRLGSLFLLLIFATGVEAQFPTSFQYQAVLRDGNGNILANQSVAVRFTMHGGSTSGPIRYQEIQNTSTNEFGLINTTVLNGTVVIPGNIYWSTETNYLQVEVNTGGNFLDLGTQQILAVPYALHAGNAQIATQVAGMELENQIDGAVIMWDEGEGLWLDRKIPSYWPTETQQYITIPGRGIWHHTTGEVEGPLDFVSEMPIASAVVDVEISSNLSTSEVICNVPDADCKYDPKLTPVQFPPNSLITSFTLHGSGSVKAKLFRQHLSNPGIIELIAEDMPDTVMPFDDHLVNNVSYSYYVVVEPIYILENTEIGLAYHSQFSLFALQVGYSLPNE